MRRRVVITGIGAVTPLGLSMQDTWNGLVEGISVAGPVRRFDARQFPVQMAYEVDGFKLAKDLVLMHEVPHMSDICAFAINATKEALEQAHIPIAGPVSDRTSVCFGVGLQCPQLSWYDQVHLQRKFDDPSLIPHIHLFPDQMSSILGRLMGAGGGITSVHTACASSGQAMGEAYDQILSGDVDLVLTGGTDSMISPFYHTGFNLLGALSKRNDSPKTASRPFDRDRDGFVFGEGACVFVFEELEHAKARGATILGEVCGYGVTESAYRITDLHPEGTGPVEAMQMALDDAGITAAEVGYINAHGTSTQLNDRIEALAIAKVFGEFAPRTYVSSTKSMTGHMIAAAGAIEFAFCVKALEHQVLPPSINLFNPDPDCRVNLTPPQISSHPMNYALSNSVGFGGSNTALIAGRGTV
ncbi:MAG: beta-ketoacyl-[acyl-carrier-protein] synthase family protein [Deltaproteobacteria bacterium]|nr:beta-ketoacyl-[acyl-carrier-protein] synthase family protein [Deltaproteobacteria bacterium]